MKKLIFVFVLMMTLSLVAAQTNNGLGVGTQNSGDDSELGIQERIRSGNYTNAEGVQMQVQTENGFKLRVGDDEVESDLEVARGWGRK